jgi:hypothetical protein
MGPITKMQMHRERRFPIQGVDDVSCPSAGHIFLGFGGRYVYAEEAARETGKEA